MSGLKEDIGCYFSDLKKVLILGLLGIGIGAVTAVFEVIFGKILSFVIAVHQQHPLLWLGFLPAAGFLVVGMFEKLGGSAKKGMNLVFEVSQGISLRIPKRLVALMTGATWLSNLAGASVGREGVAVQIGATVSHVIGRNLPFFKDLKGGKTIFLVTGMAAGFAGLFGTPFTAVFFALEVLVAGTLKYRALPSALCASFSASCVSSLLGLHKEAFPLFVSPVFDVVQVGWKLVLLGVLFGLTGGAFAQSLKWTKKHAAQKISNPYLRAAAGGAVLAVLFMVCSQGRYSCTGGNLIEMAFEGGTIYSWDWILKFILTIGSLGVGFVGGEVTPLFAIGSTLGLTVGPLLGLDPLLCAALGYAAVFGAGTNTWLAAMMVGMEIFGFAYFPFFFVVCSAAYLMNQNESIYALQRRFEDGKEA
ncbi:MAG: chloride channel protein [Ileibacterium sp.]|nr:chloride channel protein [Ileibacterium sp.]